MTRTHTENWRLNPMEENTVWWNLFYREKKPEATAPSKVSPRESLPVWVGKKNRLEAISRNLERITYVSSAIATVAGVLGVYGFATVGLDQAPFAWYSTSVGIGSGMIASGSWYGMSRAEERIEEISKNAGGLGDPRF